MEDCFDNDNEESNILPPEKLFQSLEIVEKTLIETKSKYSGDFSDLLDKITLEYNDKNINKNFYTR